MLAASLIWLQASLAALAVPAQSADVLDTTFDPGAGANDIVFAVAVQPDGKVLIGGQFTQTNGITHNGIARLNADGSLDSVFTSSRTGAMRTPVCASRRTSSSPPIN
jgi:hypothetical protein